MKPCIKFPVIFSGIALGVGGLSAIITRNSMDTYEKINQPFFAPPGWIFPIVWITLYILMGIGAGLIWCAPRNVDKKPSAIFIWGLQLVVNFFWSIIFFNLEQYKASFVWLLFLLALILIMVSAFYKVSKTAAYLQIPYILWVAFAGILNLSIAILN